MTRFRAKCVLAAALGLLTTIAVSWLFAAFATGQRGPSGQGVFAAADRSVPFGRSDGWGMTRLYWRAMSNKGPQWGTADDLYVLPSWSVARRLPGPFPPSGDFPKMAQTFEVATGWPFRAMRSEFRDFPQGTPRPPSGPYVTASGIPLPTRMINRAFLATALPYEPIWPGFPANSAIFALYWLALLAGVPAGRRILRAARGRCLGCGYDTVGVPQGSVCPECGVPTAPTGTLGRWRPAVLAAAVLLAAVGGSALSLAVAESRGLDPQRLKPLWLLRREARSQTPSAALEEINRRIAAKNIGPDTVRELVADALVVQAGEQPWPFRWGDLIEAAHGAGLVAEDQWKKYAEQAVRFTLVPRSPVRVGDVTPFLVEQECRVGRGRLIGVDAKALPPSLDGVAGTIAPNADPRFRVPPEPRPSIARHGHSQLYPFGRGQSGSGWSVQPPEQIAGERWAYEVTWPHAARTGQSELAVELDLRLFESTYAAGTNPSGPMTRPTGNTTIVERTITLRAPLRIVDAAVQTVTLVTPADAEAIARGVKPIDQAAATAWARPPHFERNGNLLIAAGNIELESSPVAFAFDVIWRRADREWLVGRFAVPANQHKTTRSYRGSGDGIEPGPIDLVLRPSIEAALNDPGIYEIWGRELVFPGFTIDPPPPPPQRNAPPG